jgi:LCP family protein required for cell wall assembly
VDGNAPFTAGTSDDDDPPAAASAHPSNTLRALLITWRTVVALLSAAVIAVTWYGWTFFRTLNEGVTTTDVIPSSVAAAANAGRKPLDGAVDILLVGIDSRTDAQGKPLSREVLDLLNGGRPDGEMNTDTMILVHVPVDGTRAIAFSFPRDSYVDIADDFGRHKLNSAFARQKNTVAQELRDRGVTDSARIEQESTLAGRKTLIKTIENLTGGSVTIDRYAEVNLASFYEVTKAIGGVEVCLKEATSEPDSGANFRKGPQIVEGASALSFVRQRKNLPGGDLDRIVRQQVFIGALAKKVLSTGTLADTAKLDDLVSAVKKSVVLSQGWDVTTFAEQMQGLVGGNIQFRTIPVGDPRDVAEDGNVLPVNPAQVRQFISGLASDTTTSRAPASTSAVPNSRITVSTYNASNTSGLAAAVLDALSTKGFVKGKPASAPVVETTVVHYGSGDQPAADQVVQALGGQAATQLDETLQRGHVDVYLGTDYTGLGSRAPGQSGPQAATNPATGASTPSSAGTPSTAPLVTGGDSLLCVN